MFTATERERTAISELCTRYGVARLELFGSAAEDRFDAERSDLDFLVEFMPDHELGPWLRHYFDLKEGLEDLFGRSVDLV
ncbi:MAG: nucleotidyltransferase domain-containing protein, partial [Bdellovibrionota bacterium]